MSLNAACELVGLHVAGRNGEQSRRYAVQVRMLGPYTGDTYTLILCTEGSYLPMLSDSWKVADANTYKVKRAIEYVSTGKAKARGVLLLPQDKRLYDRKHEAGVAIEGKDWLYKNPICFLLFNVDNTRMDAGPRLFDSQKEASAHLSEVLDAMTVGGFDWTGAVLDVSGPEYDRSSTGKEDFGQAK